MCGLVTKRVEYQTYNYEILGLPPSQLGRGYVTALGKMFTYLCSYYYSGVMWYRSAGGDALQLGR